jgi:hypothetical protein
VRAVISDELIGSVYDHLRGVDAVYAKTGAVLALTFCVLMRREAIVPTEVVPIIDVLSEDNDFGVLNGLIVIELSQ